MKGCEECGEGTAIEEEDRDIDWAVTAHPA